MGITHAGLDVVDLICSERGSGGVRRYGTHSVGSGRVLRDVIDYRRGPIDETQRTSDRRSQMDWRRLPTPGLA